MVIETAIQELRLKHTFQISREALDVRQVVHVRVTQDGISGWGEASPSARYGEDTVTTRKALQEFDAGHLSPEKYGNYLRQLDEYFEGQRAAQAALDMAIWDWNGKKIGQPMYQMLGLDLKKIPMSSYTIGIADEDTMRRKIREAEKYPILKVKLGGGNDEETIEIVRSETDKPIQVDANEAWERDEALEKIRWLQDKRVTLVEQPLAANDMEGTAWLRKRVKLPIYADESVQRLGDVSDCAEVFDGINIKLMKCGGPTEAVRMIQVAIAMGLKIMLGCMIESTLGIAAAAHLSPLANTVDLDGHLLIEDDPFEGLDYRDGKILPSDRPGLGIQPRQDITFE